MNDESRPESRPPFSPKSDGTTPCGLPPPWWLPADDAELAVLVHEIVRAAWAHKTCAACRELNTWCPSMREAAQAMLEWRQGRMLLSKAEYLRALEEAQAA